VGRLGCFGPTLESDEVVRAGSLSHPTANKIRIVKKGEKFPPLMYDSEVAPGAVDDWDARRNDDDEEDPRRSSHATKVTPFAVH
jgi:hypothetical protein